MSKFGIFTIDYTVNRHALQWFEDQITLQSYLQSYIHTNYLHYAETVGPNIDISLVPKTAADYRKVFKYMAFCRNDVSKMTLLQLAGAALAVGDAVMQKDCGCCIVEIIIGKQF